MKEGPPQPESRPFKEPRPSTPEDWEAIGRLIDRMRGDPPGTRLAIIAERLELGLPANLTSVEMLATTAEVVAHDRIARGEGPSLDPQRICELARIQTGEQFGDTLARSLETTVD